MRKWAYWHLGWLIYNSAWIGFLFFDLRFLRFFFTSHWLIFLLGIVAFKLIFFGIWYNSNELIKEIKKGVTNLKETEK